MTLSASWHATNTLQVSPSPQQSPLVKPDVQNYRIRLRADGNDLTIWDNCGG